MSPTSHEHRTPDAEGPKIDPFSGDPIPSAEDRRRKVRARGFLIAGIVLILASALQLSDAGYGHDPHREFANRRSYNTVKRSVHDALPMTILLGGSGLALIALGTWLGRPKGDTAKSS